VEGTCLLSSAAYAGSTERSILGSQRRSGLDSDSPSIDTPSPNCSIDWSAPFHDRWVDPDRDPPPGRHDSGKAETDELARRVRHQADAYLRKPFSGDEQADALTSVLVA